ncbi:Thiosulfate sulfurtransferase GlpE [Paenibacillus auburnensis]|uniref:Thiosulfate sulfurtransferase GlpE n=1 Tax=Paenibacillus auburnensis TaxID=2905649 RepID=A0ABM9BQ75_9BACL|nr:sulfurtransferase TusA family protein [Paenibacillus auburnensis]CAH1192120.1 Thiosulfate sulfurtransferase GlpE [Paenibacillus auburnensis]
MPLIKADQSLDCKGLACPMPIVKTKKAMDQLEAGQVIEVQATDKGSLADLKGWAKNTGHQYLGTIEEDNVLKHYLRKASPDEIKEQKKYMHVITNEELEKKLVSDEIAIILDVREPAEYAFNRIQGAFSVPLGELENRLYELNPEDSIYVICRTGARSDMACQLLAAKGFKDVHNVEPGMSTWSGPTESN